MRLTLVLLVLLSLLAAGCSTFKFPGVHRITIQQGNVITQAMVDKLKPGMTKNQVRFVLGNAVISDSLNRNRWDYVYTVQVSGGRRFRQQLSLYFVDEQLSHFESTIKPGSAEPVTAQVNVP